jgi:hypothetical protein
MSTAKVLAIIPCFSPSLGTSAALRLGYGRASESPRRCTHPLWQADQ